MRPRFDGVKSWPAWMVSLHSFWLRCSLRGADAPKLALDGDKRVRLALDLATGQSRMRPAPGCTDITPPPSSQASSTAHPHRCCSREARGTCVWNAEYRVMHSPNHRMPAKRAGSQLNAPLFAVQGIPKGYLSLATSLTRRAERLWPNATRSLPPPASRSLELPLDVDGADGFAAM
jgi:hypothetical protein